MELGIREPTQLEFGQSAREERAAHRVQRLQRVTLRVWMSSEQHVHMKKLPKDAKRTT